MPSTATTTSTPHRPSQAAGGTLTPNDRAIARKLRQAARIVGHAALPGEYRCTAFARVLELELDDDDAVQAAA